MTPWEQEDERFMRAALEEARAAARRGEVPIGAVVVRDGRILSRAGNSRQQEQDPAGHAELTALRAAARALGSWRLTGCTLYVTLEPCSMCAGAIVLSRVDRLVFASRDPKAGAVGSLYDIPRDPRLNHRPEITEGVLGAECAEVLKGFFRERRRRPGPEDEG